MAKLLKLRRGTTSQHGSFTGAEGEVTVDTDKETLVIHDGSTAGGHPVAAEDMANVSSANIVGRLGTGSIVRGKLAADIIDGTKLDNDAVDSEHYVDGSIDHVHLSNDCIDGDNIQDDVINSEHYVAGSIDHEHLANDIIDGDNIQNDVINSEHIAAGAVDLEHMSSESVDEDNLKISNAGTNGQYLQKQSGDAGGLTWATVSQTPEGTAVLSTGESGGTKFLREDGDNSCSWQPMPVPTSITVADESVDTVCNVLFTTAATGNLAPKTGTNLTFNSNTGELTATGFTGNLTGTASKATNVTVADESSDTTCFPTFVTAATGDLPPKTGSNLTFNSSTGALVATIVEDSKGNVRSIPINTQANAYTIAASDAGKTILASNTLYVNNNTMQIGDAVTIINNTAGNITITKQINTMYWTADGTNATRTLATRGSCTILYTGNTECYISGSGLS